MELSDQDLIRSAVGGDPAAFRALLDRHYDTVYAIAYRYCGNREDAEDIAQEVCLGLVSKLGSYRGQSQFKTWIFRITVNAARDHHRRRAASGRMQETYAELSDMERKEAIASATDLVWLYQCLSRLNDAMRDTAVLILAEGMSHREAAQVLEVKESTISWRMHELKAQLKAFALEEELI